MARTLHQRQHLKKTFLAHFAESGNVSAACRQTGIERSTVWRWQESDDTFAAAYREANVKATEHLESIALQRAEGFTKTKRVLELLRDKLGRAVLDQDGQPKYVVTEETTSTEASDTLLIFLLKARAPEKYRERSDVTTGGQPLTAPPIIVPAVLPQYVAADEERA